MKFYAYYIIVEFVPCFDQWRLLCYMDHLAGTVLTDGTVS